MKHFASLLMGAAIVTLSSAALAQAQTGAAEDPQAATGQGEATIAAEPAPPAAAGDAAAAPEDAGAPAPMTVPASALTAEQFVQTATVSDTFEIQSSQLAVDQSENEAIRNFAEQMIADHTASSEALAQAAQEDGAPAVAPYLDARMQAMLTQLEGAEGEAFDAEYVRMQVQAHQEAVTLYEAFAGREGALGAFAAETLPKLRAHLEMVQGLQAS